MTPACAGWGNGHTSIGVNRRADSAQLDDRLGVLKVTDPATGELRLLLLRLTAHANEMCIRDRAGGTAPAPGKEPRGGGV